MSYVALPLLILGACTTTDDRVPRAVTSATGDLARVVQGSNGFTFDTYRQVVEGDDGNVFLSPFSLSAALSMTMAGADGATLAEMQQVLGASGDPATWHAAFGALLQDLDGEFDRGYTLQVANRLFGQPDYPWSPSFLGVCADDYGAPLDATDFVADPEAGRTKINGWVAEQTNGRIDELMPGGSVTTDTRLVLANAIYFLADWQIPFEPEATRDVPFTRLDGSTVNAPTMSLSTAAYEDHGVAVGVVDGATVVRLPYADDEVSMILVIPEATDGLPALEAGLTDAVFDGWLAALGPRGTSLNLLLPKFTMNFEVDAGSLLGALGMPSLFTTDADLSAMTDPPGNDLTVASVFHQAFVNVDEKGTEAAAASAVNAVALSYQAPLAATHPFLFVIRDDLTGSVLFVGRVMDPTAE